MRHGAWTLLCLLGAATAGVAQTSVGKQLTVQLSSCTANNCLAQRTVWDHMLNDVAPCLVPHHTWSSSHAPRLPVTLITQLSGEVSLTLQAAPCPA